MLLLKIPQQAVRGQATSVVWRRQESLHHFEMAKNVVHHYNAHYHSDPHGADFCPACYSKDLPCLEQEVAAVFAA